MIKALHYKTLRDAIQGRMETEACKAKESTGWAARWAIDIVWRKGGVVIIHIWDRRFILGEIK